MSREREGERGGEDGVSHRMANEVQCFGIYIVCSGLRFLYQARNGVQVSSAVQYRKYRYLAVTNPTPCIASLFPHSNGLMYGDGRLI